EPRGQAPGRANVAGGLDLELVGRQSLHADRGPVTVAAGGIRVMAKADRAIPPGAGGVAPEQFRAGVFQPAAAAFAFAAQPELVEVAADARAQVPADGVVLAVLEPIAAEYRDQRVVTHVRAHVHAFQAGRKRCSAL